MPKNSSHKYTNATAFSNAAIRFISPADETMRAANPVWYFANRTLHACDVISNQRPSSHVTVSSYIASSQFANYQTPQYKRSTRGADNWVGWGNLLQLWILSVPAARMLYTRLTLTLTLTATRVAGLIRIHAAVLCSRQFIKIYLGAFKMK